MLGAGVGRRLGDVEAGPKILLEFGGRSLLARHVDILRACGVTRIDLVIGYQAAAVEAEIARLGAGDLVHTIFNPDYEDGAILSFCKLAETLSAGEPVLFMDGDVLYDRRLMARLVTAPDENCFLMDRTTEDGDDPVKLCLRRGVLVDFHKRPQRAYDWWGEWVGFCRFSPVIAAEVAAAARAVAAEDRGAIYEEAIRRVLLQQPPGTFGVVDITGLPWIEIDFPEDLARARSEIFARLVDDDEAVSSRAASGGS